MNIFKLSIKNIFNRPLSSVLSVILLSLGVSMISLLILINTVLKEQMDNNLKGIDMVVGAKGSPLQLILSSVYHVDSPTGNIPLNEAKAIEKNKMVGNSVPLLYGDNFKGYRIVGTNSNFFELYNLKIKAGDYFNNYFEAVIGAKVAEKLNLNLGDEFVSSHGLRETSETHDDTSFSVTGILEYSNSVADNLILTSPNSIWEIHADHNHSEQIDHDDEHDHDEHDHDEHDHDEHDHDEHDHDNEREITAMLVKFKSPMNIIQFPRYINEQTNLQSAVPSYEISRLFKLFGFGIETISLLAYLIIIVSGISIFITLFNSMKERKYDLALIRTLGGTRIQLTMMLIFESLFLTIIGFLMGVFLSRIGLLFISNFMESSFNFSLNKIEILSDEWWLFLISITIGLISCLIPSIQVYKMDISKILSDE
ncbi:MAG: ABC transporter permease [Flavobacteriaceae bacterium]|nr:ABC transporter permease [Flavobacteriaceae bacterium]